MTYVARFIDWLDGTGGRWFVVVMGAALIIAGVTR